MKPSEYVSTYGHIRHIAGLQQVLFEYEKENGDDIEQLKAITPPEMMSEQTMRRINEYELEVRIGNEAIQNWRTGQ